MKNFLDAMRELVGEDSPQGKLLDAMQKDIEEQDAEFDRMREESRKRQEELRAKSEERRRKLLDRW